MEDDQDYLMLSGIQHFQFCKRQWAFIHVEQQWAENVRTIEGEHLHRNADKPFVREKRGDKLIVRAMPVKSDQLKLSGICDVVEFTRSENGVEINGATGKYIAVPVEYKRGKPKRGDEDLLQLAAQAICLEEMLLCEVPSGYLYYEEIKHRVEVPISDELRVKVKRFAKEMWDYYERRYTPKSEKWSLLPQLLLATYLFARAHEQTNGETLCGRENQRMKKLLNTLFISQSDVYLSLDGDNIVLLKEDQKIGRLPLHNLESIISFGYTGASPALMGYCAERHISMVFFTMNGRFLARVIGESNGNVVLRKKQYLISDDVKHSARIARNFIIGKVYNHKWLIERMTRDYPLRIDVDRFKNVSRQLSESLVEIRACEDLEELRGLEGQAAYAYNKLIDSMILQQKEQFYFHSRTRRPPLDNVNAMLSFAYSLLANDVAAALEGVGLDAYVGFLHRDRPGRVSLALDVMEELRGVYADRFVLTLINTKVMNKDDFVKKENGAVLMKDEARKKFLTAWQQKKQEKITHPFLSEQISWGLVPHAQALLLARFLRNDLDEYPPFLWK